MVLAHQGSLLLRCIFYTFAAQLQLQMHRLLHMQAIYIFGNEACERFSFYGMRSILIVYLTSHLHLEDHSAESIYHAFASACYLLPLAGR